MANKVAVNNYNKYSEQDRVTTFIAYRLEGHNAEAASRVTGVPAQTIRRWVAEWNKDGFIPGQEAWVEETVAGFAGKSIKIRDKALARLEKQVDKAENIGQLMTVVDKLNNIARVSAGQATSIVEERIIDADAISAALAKYIDQSSQATIDRHEIVVDADFEEQVLGIEDTPEPKE